MHRKKVRTATSGVRKRPPSIVLSVLLLWKQAAVTRHFTIEEGCAACGTQGTHISSHAGTGIDSASAKG